MVAMIFMASSVTNDNLSVFQQIHHTDDGFGASTVTDNVFGTSVVTDDGFGASTVTDDDFGASTITDDGDTYPFLSPLLPPMR